MPFGDFSKRRFLGGNLADKLARTNSKIDEVARRRTSIKSLDDLTPDLGSASRILRDENGIPLMSIDDDGYTLLAGVSESQGSTIKWVNEDGDLYASIAVAEPDPGQWKMYLRVFDSGGSWISGVMINNDGTIITPSGAYLGYGYEKYIGASNQATLTDGQTVFWGCLPLAASTTTLNARTYFMRPGIIKAADISVTAGTAGSNEDWSMYIRLNDTTDYFIKTVGVSALRRRFNSNTLNVPIVVGDFIEIKEVFPTWATNPANVVRGGYLYVE